MPSTLNLHLFSHSQPIHILKGTLPLSIPPLSLPPSLPPSLPLKGLVLTELWSSFALLKLWLRVAKSDFSFKTSQKSRLICENQFKFLKNAVETNTYEGCI